MIKPTRFRELGYANVSRTCWRFIDLSTLAKIGPYYGTRSELLADLSRFAKLFGCC